MPDLRDLINAERLRRGWSVGRLLRESGLPVSRHNAGYRFLAGKSNSTTSLVGPLLVALDLLDLSAAAPALKPPPGPNPA